MMLSKQWGQKTEDTIRFKNLEAELQLLDNDAISNCNSRQENHGYRLPPTPLHKLTKSINVECKTSRDKFPKNFLYSGTTSEVSKLSFLSSINPSSITNHHERHPWGSSGSTWATSRSVSPCSSSNDRLRKSRLAFIPQVRASSWSQRIIWLATCGNTMTLIFLLSSDKEAQKQGNLLWIHLQQNYNRKIGQVTAVSVRRIDILGISVEQANNIWCTFSFDSNAIIIYNNFSQKLCFGYIIHLITVWCTSLDAIRMKYGPRNFHEKRPRWFSRIPSGMRYQLKKWDFPDLRTNQS